MIVLPFPPASLSGHNNGLWRTKARVVATHRAWAFHATREVKAKAAGDGDIPITIKFYAPNNLGDRTNYPNRMKPYFDGIAEALGVNDRRFLPSFQYMPNAKPGRVEVIIYPPITAEQAKNTLPETPESCKENAGRESASTLDPGPKHQAKGVAHVSESR